MGGIEASPKKKQLFHKQCIHPSIRNLLKIPHFYNSITKKDRNQSTIRTNTALLIFHADSTPADPNMYMQQHYCRHSFQQRTARKFVRIPSWKRTRQPANSSIRFRNAPGRNDSG